MKKITEDILNNPYNIFMCILVYLRFRTSLLSFTSIGTQIIYKPYAGIKNNSIKRRYRAGSNPIALIMASCES